MPLRRPRRRPVRLLALAIALAPTLAAAQSAPDRIDTPLTMRVGDIGEGRRIVQDRALSACLLCHTGPFPAPYLQGTIGPDLTGVGSRLDSGQIRLRIVSSARVNPNTVMPSYFQADGLNRVAPRWKGHTILTADQVEDVVAFLSTLRMP